MPETTSKSTSKMRYVSLPEGLVSEVEELMNKKYERRPVKVAIGVFIGDMIRSSMDKEKTLSKITPLLEEYAVEKDAVYVKDYKRDVIAELRFKDACDLYCNVDAAKNCVHVGYAWSIPAVQELIYERSSKDSNANPVK